MIDTAFELMEYLDMRGARYGIQGSEILEAIPDSVSSPKQAHEFMKLKDISHIEPLSKGGDPAGDNWILEDSSVNRSRRDQTMTETEIQVAQADNLIDAKALKRGALMGGALTVGSAAAEGGLLAIEAISIAPTLLTIAAIGGAGWLGWKAYKKLSKA